MHTDHDISQFDRSHRDINLPPEERALINAAKSLWRMKMLAKIKFLSGIALGVAATWLFGTLLFLLAD